MRPATQRVRRGGGFLVVFAASVEPDWLDVVDVRWRKQDSADWLWWTKPERYIEIREPDPRHALNDAIPLGLDHPEAVTPLACLDILPTLDMWDAMHGTSAAVGFHLYLMAPNLHHQTVGYGHFMAEEAPAEIARALRDLLAR